MRSDGRFAQGLGERIEWRAGQRGDGGWGCTVPPARGCSGGAAEARTFSVEVGDALVRLDAFGPRLMEWTTSEGGAAGFRVL